MQDTNRNPEGLAKVPTGIAGLDEITGGLPRGRTILVAGGPGCGKTLLAMEFLVRGAEQFGEPGVFVSFEEAPEELARNVASFGWDLERLAAENKFIIDHVVVERSEIEETGEYDLEGLFVRLAYAIDAVGAKRIALDTLESLFSSVPNETVLRSELRRLFRWIKERGLTAIITGERGDKTLTRHGLEEYVSDCVIELKHDVQERLSTRQIRIVKYRGSAHGSNEYPFLIEEHGISILPITSAGLNYEVSSERISSGIPKLDELLGGPGYYRGSSVLVTGTAGTGKSSLAALFADSTCRGGERVLYVALEEPPSQILRNMRSISIDLRPHVEAGLLNFMAERPTAYELERHLLLMQKRIRDLQPAAVIVDPISSFGKIGTPAEIAALLTRFIDFIKGRGIVSLFTDLSSEQAQPEHGEGMVSSIMDTWILLRNIEINGERNRGLYVLKSRGMGHSNQVREFIIADSGVDLVDIKVGPEGVLTGSARIAQEMMDGVRSALVERERQGRAQSFERKKAAIQARIREFEAELAAEQEQFDIEDREAQMIEVSNEKARQTMAGRRQGGATDARPGDKR